MNFGYELKDAEKSSFERTRTLRSAKDAGVFGVVHVSVHVGFWTDVGV